MSESATAGPTVTHSTKTVVWEMRRVKSDPEAARQAYEDAKARLRKYAAILSAHEAGETSFVNPRSGKVKKITPRVLATARKNASIFQTEVDRYESKTGPRTGGKTAAVRDAGIHPSDRALLAGARWAEDGAIEF